MADLYALTEQDLRTLRQVIDLVRGNRYGRGTIPLGPRYVQAPEAYVAKTPVGGIPARSGTTPGSATCTFYEMDAGVLVSTGLTEKVYNLSTTAVAADAYFLVQRDKFNSWFVDQGGGAAAASGITIAEVDGSPSYASTTTITLAQEDGFLLSQPSANVARIDIRPATATQAGMIDTGNQTLAGVKTFTHKVTFDAAGSTTASANGFHLISGANTKGSLYWLGDDTTNAKVTLQAWAKTGNTATGASITLEDEGVNLESSGTPAYGVEGVYGQSTTLNWMMPDGVSTGFATFTGGILTASGSF